MHIFVLGSFVQACCWSVPRIPKSGETLRASSLHIEAGGKGLNVAICCRRLGMAISIALGIGHDSAADELAGLLNSEGINADYVYRLAAQSGYGAGFIGADGDNVIAVFPGPNLLLSDQHLQLASGRIQQSDLVYGQFETSLSAISQAFALARQAGVCTVLNPSPWQNIPADILDNTDIIIVNEIEVCELLRIEGLHLNQDINTVIHIIEQALEPFWSAWISDDRKPGSQQNKLFIVTLGCYGSLALSPQQATIHCPAFQIEAIDTVGAGDAFASGFCTGLLQEKPMPELLQYANACGAIVASNAGVLNALPDHTTVTAFVNTKLAKH